MNADRIIAWALALALTIAPALGYAQGLMTLGAGSVRAAPSGPATLACAYTPVTTGTEGTAYTGATPSPSGGTSPYTFSETGTLPTGLSINASTGVISGTPSVSGSFPSIQVSVADSASHTANCGAAFTLVISAPTAGINFQVTATPAALITPPTNVFDNVSIGTPASNRVVIVAVALNQNGPVTGCAVVTSAGTTNLTLAAADTPAGTSSSSLWFATIPAGTTATSITCPTTDPFPNEISIAVMTINSNSGTIGTPQVLALGFNQDPQVTPAVTVPTGGIAILAGTGGPSNATETINWPNSTGTTGTFDVNAVSSDGNLTQVVGHIEIAGSQTPSITGWNFAGFGMTVVPFNP
jgi:hypothetical protein